MSFSKQVLNVIRKNALINAHHHGGKPDPGATLGRTIAEVPELRARVKDLMPEVRRVCEEVAKLSTTEQEAELRRSHPEALEERKPVKEERRLPPLPNVDKYTIVVTRFAPNPDSVLHLGSTRAIILSHDYARMYDGKFILRYEDTDPRLKKSALAYYDYIKEDLAWLGCVPDEVYIQSDRMEVYYKYAEQLLKRGGGYVCTCAQETFHSLALVHQACPCRALSVEENLVRWRRMLDGAYNEGEAVLRVKTDLEHPNPAVRDWPAMRVIDTTKHRHPRVGSKYRVWPLYNWAAGLDDHLLGVTHIIRGQEHYTNMVRQKYFYKVFGWPYPEAIHYGRLKIEGGVLSKSKIEAGLRQKLYTGYDDPRLATLRALRRRGISVEAIRRLIYEVGPKPIDAVISWDNLLAANRQIIDRKSSRYFAVLGEPVKLTVKGVKHTLHVELPRHPELADRPARKFDIPVVDGSAHLLVNESDVQTLTSGALVRLMGLMNVKEGRASASGSGEGLVAVLDSYGVEEARKAKAPAVHWLPCQGNASVEVVMADATIQRGLVEKGIVDEKEDATVQLERLFFARVDSVSSNAIRLYFTSR
jgi:glutamyl-tRNA synthetase